MDEETLLVDLEACTRGDVICQKSGPVSATEALVDGRVAVRMIGRSSISLPLNRNDGRKLAWIAIGLRSQDVGRKLAVTITGQVGAVAEPTWGWARVEIAQGDITPAPDARLNLVAEAGTFELLWVVGRWKRE